MEQYIRIGNIIKNSTPAEKKPLLTDKQIDKLKNIGEIVLGLTAVAGVITVSLLAPNAMIAIDKLFLKKYPKKKFTKKEKDRKLAQAFYYMKQKGLVRMKLSGNDYKVFLTQLGKRKLRKLSFNTLSIKKPAAWDGKWWQVAADIPTKKYRRGADLLRQKLKDMNFFPLQRTLWFYPHDPREEIEYIASHYSIGQFVTVMEINRLDKDDERKMWKHFRGLKIITLPEI